MLSAVRAAARLSRLALHLLLGIISVALAYPRAGTPRRLQLKQRWSRQLLRCIGVELHVSGAMPDGLIVANHISFLDIFAINAVAPVAFVSKDEVRHWPLIGWLASRTDTVFLERGSRAAAQRARNGLVEQLRSGGRVAVFPEGTTSRGDGILPFHGALFQAAIDAGAAVTPVALRYLGRDGRCSDAPAYVDAVTLWQCLRAIVHADGLAAHVEVLAPLSSTAVDRRHLAAHAHRIIAHAVCVGVDVGDQTRPALPHPGPRPASAVHSGAGQSSASAPHRPGG
ncbi:MAG: 1-acyl-sn-glycerol-3-phosphate acyltransferase [Gammaproteobacteria bacterium]|nr:1-acyl-sn-glycerol-3-phosphate acyltransferase [Gammaproteobacteria bacterium]MBU1647202.1 1-acyl-sn-glycerol-3-phosphate acyltransferase [Gammaproteobacteria bacterium]MBU1972714.1 1-acyl-sn-glycerol-3-phosphate acyltransferase [Gammaproteobacteria bacterium]